MPADDTVLRDTTAPAIGISVQVSIDASRQIVFQTHVAQEVETAVLNAVLDKLNKAADRQAAYYALEMLDRQLFVDNARLEDYERELPQIEERAQSLWGSEGRKGPFRLSAQEATQKKQAVAGLEQQRKNVERLNKQREELTAKIG